MKRTLVGATLFALVLGAGTAVAQDATDAPAVLARVEALLVGYERVPTPADWEAAGPREQVAKALLAIATKPGERTSTRARALVGMRYAPTDAVRAHLLAVVGDAAAGPVLRGKAALSLGAVAQEAALAPLSKLLTETDAPLREAALRGIGQVRTRAAIELLAAHEAKEAEPHVRELARSLATELRAVVP